MLPHTGRSSAPAESARDGEIDPGREYSRHFPDSGWSWGQDRPFARLAQRKIAPGAGQRRSKPLRGPAGSRLTDREAAAAIDVVPAKGDEPYERVITAVTLGRLAPRDARKIPRAPAALRLPQPRAVAPVAGQRHRRPHVAGLVGRRRPAGERRLQPQHAPALHGPAPMAEPPPLSQPAAHGRAAPSLLAPVPLAPADE